MDQLKRVLTIAGSDTSGGAGIQADLKTFEERDVYGVTAITVIVTMDPDGGWSHNVFPIDIDIFKSQLKTALSLKIDAFKTGMLGSIELIEYISDAIEKHGMTTGVVDPVMVCKGANEPLNPEVNGALRDLLVPKALVVTPNLFEASQLAGCDPIATLEDMKNAAGLIHESGVKYVLIKGGAKLGTDTSIDLLYDGKEFEVLESELIPTTNTHGAGCTYSAAITAELAKGQTVHGAVKTAKNFITEAIRHSYALNEYVGPVRHNALRMLCGK